VRFVSASGQLLLLLPQNANVLKEAASSSVLAATSKPNVVIQIE
jgi:hypothetical protein